MTITVPRGHGPLGITCIKSAGRVTSVLPGSSAAAAGLQTFDRITAVNGVPLVSSLSQVVAGLGEKLSEGVPLQLSIERPPASEHSCIKHALTLEQVTS